MLIYTRPKNDGYVFMRVADAHSTDNLGLAGDHIWRDAEGAMMLWKGATAWYYADEAGETRRLCALEWPDGDAIALYRAKMRIASGAEP